VKVIREYSDGTKEIGIVDLNDADVLNSPFFHIRQDDVVYVEPNRAKVRNADVAMSSSLWIRGFSIGLSLLALVFSIIR
jgi:polysaccharide export outer membrane protein